MPARCGGACGGGGVLLGVLEVDAHEGPRLELPLDGDQRHQGDPQPFFHHSFSGLERVQLHRHIRNDTGLPEEVVDQAVVGRTAVEEDDRLSGGLAHGGAAARGEGVLGWGGKYDLVFIQVDRFDIAVGEGTNEADLHLVGEEHVHHLLRAPGADDDVDAGVLPAEGVENAGQDVGRDSWRRAEPERASLHVLHLTDRVAALLQSL